MAVTIKIEKKDGNIIETRIGADGKPIKEANK